jgi:hypothetical protein
MKVRIDHYKVVPLLGLGAVAIQVVAVAQKEAKTLWNPDFHPAMVTAFTSASTDTGPVMGPIPATILEGLFPRPVPEQPGVTDTGGSDT